MQSELKMCWPSYNYLQCMLDTIDLEIVMNEMRKLMMSADFFENTSHDICRCPGV